MDNEKSNIFGNIKERILQIGDFYHVGRKNICEKIGMTYGNFTGKAKETPINSIAIQNIIVNFPMVNIHWLLTGKGDMLINESIQQPINDDIEGLKRLIKAQETIIELQKENAALKAEKERLTAENCQMKINLSKTITSIKREPQRE